MELPFCFCSEYMLRGIRMCSANDTVIIRAAHFDAEHSCLIFSFTNTKTTHKITKLRRNCRPINIAFCVPHTQIPLASVFFFLLTRG